MPRRIASRVKAAAYRRLIYPATDWYFSRDTFAALEEIRRLETLNGEELEHYRTDRLRGLLAYAFEHVPHYRQAFTAAGLGPGDLACLDEVSRVPVLSKSELRTESDRLRSDEYPGPLKTFSTSGSTGTPLVVLEDQATNAWRRALKWRYMEWWGVEVGDPGGVVWLAPMQSVKGLILKRLGFMTNNCNTFLNVSNLSEASMARFWRQVRARRLAYIYGYTSALVKLAQFAIDSGLNRRMPLSLKVVVATTETLFARQREIMEEGFGARVANEYGCAELGDIAFECPSGRLHVAAHTYWLDLQGVLPGLKTTGEVSVTHLHKRSAPIIRYRLGDIVSLSPDACPCGRSLPVLSAVEGRVSDLITTASGVVMHSEVFDYIMREFAPRENPAVVGFRVIQHQPDAFEVLVVPGPVFGSATEEGIRGALRRTLGEAARVQITVTDSIPSDPNGKIRFFVRKF